MSSLHHYHNHPCHHILDRPSLSNHIFKPSFTVCLRPCFFPLTTEARSPHHPLFPPMHRSRDFLNHTGTRLASDHHPGGLLPKFTLNFQHKEPTPRWWFTSSSHNCIPPMHGKLPPKESRKESFSSLVDDPNMPFCPPEVGSSLNMSSWLPVSLDLCQRGSWAPITFARFPSSWPVPTSPRGWEATKSML